MIIKQCLLSAPPTPSLTALAQHEDGWEVGGLNMLFFDGARQLLKAFCRCTSGGMLCSQVACASCAPSDCSSAPPSSPPTER